MGKYRKLSHVVYKCDYHIVWVPKYRLRILKDVVKELVEEDVRMLCQWKGCEVQELNVQEDHVQSFGFGSSKSFDFQVDGHLEGKISDKAFQELSEIEEETVLGKSFLGSRLLCEHGRSR